jgi:hypothetical protein
MTATLRAVATMARRMIKEAKAPLCRRIYLRAMKKDKFKCGTGIYLILEIALIKITSVADNEIDKKGKCRYNRHFHKLYFDFKIVLFP